MSAHPTFFRLSSSSEQKSDNFFAIDLSMMVSFKKMYVILRHIAITLFLTILLVVTIERK